MCVVDKVTRLELIDYTPCTHCDGKCWININNDNGSNPKECPACKGAGYNGRTVIFWDANKKIDLSLQDEGRTLKVFVAER
jgi:DnaJ-class molecular chaperone